MMKFFLKNKKSLIGLLFVMFFANYTTAQCVTGVPALNCGAAYTTDQNDGLNGTAPDPSCATIGGGGAYGDSDWFSFTYTGNEAFSIDDTQMGILQNFAVYSGDGCTELGCSLSRTQKLNSLGVVEEMAIIGLNDLGMVIGQTYLLRVFNNGIQLTGGFGKTTGANVGIGYTIGCSEILADADDCFDAITVSDGFVQTGVTTINGTIDPGMPVPSCVGTLENAVFYRFCGNAVGDPVNINMSNITYTSELAGGAVHGFQYTIWSGDCSGLVEEDCAGINTTSQNFVFDPDPCACYYFSIDGINGDGVTFDLEFLNANNNPLEIALDNIVHESCVQCDGLIDVTVSGGTPNYVFSWVGPSGFTASTEDISVLCDGDYTLTVIDDGGCSVTQTYTIINAVGVGSSIAGFTVNTNPQCLVGNNFVFSNTGTTGAGTIFTWDFDGDLVVDDATENPSFSYVAAGTYTVTQTVDDGSGCVATATMDVTVNAMPTISGNAPICIGASVTLTGSGTPDGTTPWSSSNIGIATVNNIGVVTGVSAGVATITYMDNNGCTITTDVTVNPDPTISGATSICIDETLQLTGSASPDAVLPWSSSDDGVATIGTTGLVTGVTDGTTTITYTNTNGCQNTVDITVDPSPIISTTQTPLTGCNSNDGIILVSDIALATGTVSWTGTASGSVTSETLPYNIIGLAAGTYDVTFTDDASGCTSVISQEIFINPGAPALNPISDTTSCGVDYILLNSIITGSGMTGGQAFYTATGGPGGAGALIPDGTTYSASTNTTVFLYDENGACASEQSFTIVVNPLPTISGNVPVCINATVQLTGSGAPDGSTPWISSNTSVATVSNTGLVTALSDGTTTITYTNTNGCQNSVLFTVNATPTITNNVDLCVTGTNQLVGSGSPALISPWVSSDILIVTVDDLGEVTGVAPGTSTITYTNVNGCQITEIVTVNANPTISGDAPICIGATVQLTGSLTANGTTPWVSSNTAVATINNSGLVFGVSDGTTTITYTNSNGCQNTVDITVNPSPIISTIQTPLTGCNSNDGIIQVSDVGFATGTVIWTGTAVGLAASETLPYNIVGLASGTYNVTFTDDASGCTSVTSLEIFANPVAPVLNPILDTTSCGVDYVLLNSIITGSDLTGSQAFYTATGGPGGAGALIPDGTTYSASTNTTVFLYDENGACASEQSFTIVVNPLPTISGNAPVCVGASVQLTGSGTPDATTPWVSSNVLVATVSSTGLVLGVSDGTTTITYTNINGCQNTVLVTVNLNPTITNNLDLCVNGTNQLVGSGLPALVSPWTSSDILIVTVDNLGEVTGVDAGTSTITYTNVNGCQITEIVTVNANPTISGNVPICIGATVQLTGSLTANGTTPWVSSNTAVATVDNSGLVLGVLDGTTTITYMNDNGCSVSVILAVNASPIISTSQTGLTLCNSNDGILHVSDVGNATGTVAWTGAESGTVLNQTLQYDITGLSPGTYDVTFTDDITGCTSLVSQEILVNPGAPIITDLLDVVTCDSYVLPVISGTSMSGNQSYWSGAGGTGTQFSEGDVINTSAFFYIYDITGACWTEESFNVTLVNTPIIDPISDVTNCGNYTLPAITGTDLTANVAYYTDSQLNGGSLLTGDITTTQTVWVYDISSGLCSDEISFIVTINPLPSLVTITGGGVYCNTDPINEIMVDVTGAPDWIINYTLDGVAQSITTASSPVSLGTTEGVYVLTDVMDLNCSNVITGTQTILVNESPIQPNAGDDLEYCSTVVIEDLTVEGSGSIFTWYSDLELTDTIGTGSTFEPNSDVGVTTYYVTETAENCEGVADEIMITIVDCNITVPTAFTPDGDLNNDDWEILDIDQTYPNSVVQVYNRWGNLLYESIPGSYNQNRWDGKYENKLLPVGSYFFIIEFNDNEKGSMTGSVSIILNK